MCYKNQTLPLRENCTPEAVLQKLLDGNLKSNGTGLWLTLVARFLVEVVGAFFVTLCFSN